jgi:hypothetical protein
MKYRVPPNTLSRSFNIVSVRHSFSGIQVNSLLRKQLKSDYE